METAVGGDGIIIGICGVDGGELLELGAGAIIEEERTEESFIAIDLDDVFLGELIILMSGKEVLATFRVTSTAGLISMMINTKIPNLSLDVIEAIEVVRTLH